MKKVLMVVGLLAVAACSGSSGSPPLISDFTMASPVAAGSTTLSGSIQVADPSGLSDITLNITLSGGGATSTLSQMVAGGTATETSATVPITLILSSAPPAGSYDVTITATENGETSSSLSAMLTVQ